MDINRVEPISIEGKICIPYRWPTGSTTGFFLTKLKEQKQIYGIKCPKCNSVTVPPRQKCLQCKTISKEWIKVGMAIDAEDRCKSLQTSSPLRDYCLLYARKFNNRRKAETKTMNKLKKIVKEHNGEWFKTDRNTVQEVIERLSITL